MSKDQTVRSYPNSALESIFKTAIDASTVTVFAVPNVFITTYINMLSAKQKWPGAREYLNRVNHSAGAASRSRFLSIASGQIAGNTMEKTDKPLEDAVRRIFYSTGLETCVTSASEAQSMIASLGKTARGRAVLATAVKLFPLAFAKNAGPWVGFVSADEIKKGKDFSAMEGFAVSFAAGGAGSLLSLPFLTATARKAANPDVSYIDTLKQSFSDVLQKNERSRFAKIVLGRFASMGLSSGILVVLAPEVYKVVDQQAQKLSDMLPSTQIESTKASPDTKVKKYQASLNSDCSPSESGRAWIGRSDSPTECDSPNSPNLLQRIARVDSKIEL